MGYVFLAMTGPYTVGCILSPVLLKKVPRRLIFTVDLTFSVLAYMMLGPSTLVGFPEKNFGIIIGGLCLLGIVQGPTVVSTLPEGIDSFKAYYGYAEGIDPHLDGLMTDTFTSFHLFVKNFVSLFSPIIGGALYDNYSYETAIDAAWCFAGVIAILNLFFNCGFSPFKDRKEELEKLEKLAAIGEAARAKNRKKNALKAKKQAS